MRREQELKQLYEKIAREFPFVAKQGLKPGQKVSGFRGEGRGGLPRTFDKDPCGLKGAWILLSNSQKIAST